MVDPAPAALQPTDLLPDLVLEEIFVRLPPRQFYQYRCLSRAWAATLSSEDAIDRHIHVRGKIRLDHDSIMQQLALGCCLTAELCDIPNRDDGADRDDGEERNLREEYRYRGYVEVDKDYYIRLAETQSWLAELWAKTDFSGITSADSDDAELMAKEDFSRITFADSDDKSLKAHTVPFGTLHPRIRQPLMQEEGEAQQEQRYIMPIHGRVKTQEEVDKEIIAFLRRLRAMDPKSAFLKGFDIYGWPYVPRQE